MSNFTPSIYQQAVAQGIPTANHCSDLYLPVTPATEALVKDYEFASNVTRFTSNIDGEQWFDIPFAFDPYWEAKQRIADKIQGKN